MLQDPLSVLPAQIIHESLRCQILPSREANAPRKASADYQHGTTIDLNLISSLPPLESPAQLAKGASHSACQPAASTG